MARDQESAWANSCLRDESRVLYRVEAHEQAVVEAALEPTRPEPLLEDNPATSVESGSDLAARKDARVNDLPDSRDGVEIHLIAGDFGGHEC